MLIAVVTRKILIVFKLFILLNNPFGIPDIMINKGFYLNKIYKYINKFFVFLFDNKIKYNNILPLF